MERYTQRENNGFRCKIKVEKFLTIIDYKKNFVQRKAQCELKQNNELKCKPRYSSNISAPTRCHHHQKSRYELMQIKFSV